MKTILKTITIVLLSMTLLNCSKDDDANKNDSRTTEELLIGKWHYRVTSKGEATTCESQSYYHFIDTQNMNFRDVRDPGIFALSDYELIGDCYVSPITSVNFTLNAANQIQYLNDYEDTVTLNIISINETTLVLTQGSLIYILIKEL